MYELAYQEDFSSMVKSCRNQKPRRDNGYKFQWNRQKTERLETAFYLYRILNNNPLFPGFPVYYISRSNTAQQIINKTFKIPAANLPCYYV